MQMPICCIVERSFRNRLRLPCSRTAVSGDVPLSCTRRGAHRLCPGTHTGGDPGVNVDRILVDDIPSVQVPGRLLSLSSWTGEAHCSCVVTLTTVFSDESGWCASDW